MWFLVQSWWSCWYSFTMPIVDLLRLVRAMFVISIVILRWTSQRSIFCCDLAVAHKRGEAILRWIHLECIGEGIQYSTNNYIVDWWLNEVSIQSYCGLEWCLNAAWKLFAKVQRQNLSILGLNAERCLRNNMLFVQWRQCVPWHLLPVVDWTRAVNCCLHMWRFCQCHLCTMRPSLVMSNECTHSIIQSRDLCPRRARQGTDVICIDFRAMA